MPLMGGGNTFNLILFMFWLRDELLAKYKMTNSLSCKTETFHALEEIKQVCYQLM